VPTFNTYYFDSGTSWRVPEGVTAIQVECFGSTPGTTATGIVPNANYSGGSYSKSNSIAVTPGSTVYLNVGANGGNSWFNTSNVAPTSASSTSSACLAVGGTTVAPDQVAANCGNVKYAGGNGRFVTGTDPVILTAQGGKAGPNGPGADVGDPYSNTVLNVLGNNYLRCTGGGGNGGFQGGLGVIPYGRSGTGTAGMGQYVSGANNFQSGTGEILGTYKYLNSLILDTFTYPNGLSYLITPTLGEGGGGRTTIVSTSGCCCCYTSFSLDPQQGQVVITVTEATQKTIVYAVRSSPRGEQSFTLPTDFGSLISLEAFGSYAIRDTQNNNGGGGGGAYAKTLGTSVTASMVAGSTTVYYYVGSSLDFSSDGESSYIRIGTSGAPSSVTDGVLAKGGSRPSGTTGGTGGTTADSVGDTKYAGGNGGTGGAVNNLGGAGGNGGPLGAGARGGNGFTSTASRGDGGGGASNGGSAGANGTTSAGGAGGTITGGTGGTGATSSVAATSGTNGGGGGGGYGVAGSINGALGGILNNGTYATRGGPGGAVYYGSGGITNGFGLVVLTYAPLSGVVLTGSASSAFSGTLSPAQTLTQALSSGSADALAGTLTASQTLTIALSSAIAEAFGGTFVPSNDQVVNLSSVFALASGGTLTNSQLITQALTGVSVNGQTSSFPVFLELVGASAAGATGLFGYVNTGWQPINTAGGSTSWIDVDTQQT